MKPEEVPDLTGRTVGRFVIRARLGAGGMGEVYCADDTRLKRPVALKRIAPGLQDDEGYRQRFLREAQFASGLTNQNVAGVYDVLEENGEIFLVMEYVEGQTLRQRLAEPLSIEEFLRITVQCASALAAAHERGIVHRDIKPENIMLTPAGQVKMLDFGVAKRLPHRAAATTVDSTTPGGSFSGTLAYMAPEVLLEKQPDHRADIFSLGVVFYEALSGRQPFRGESFLATSDRILHESPTPLRRLNPKVSGELERIVAKMLAKNPGERYATAADLLVDLRNVQRAVGYTTAPAVSRHEPKRSYVLSRRGIILALVLALLAVLLWRVYRPGPPIAQRIHIAVVPFENRTGEARLDQYRLPLTQMLVLALINSPNLRVLPYERLLEITQGLGTTSKDISSPEAVKTVADYSGSQFVVVPAMFTIGKTVGVLVEVRNARTGDTVYAFKAERQLSGSSEDTFYGMLDELASRVQKHFESVGRGKEDQPRPEGGHPKTVTAALHYNEGKNAFVQGNYTRALNLYQKVLDEDPGFALAFAYMGQIYAILGYDNKARELAERAAQLINVRTSLMDAYFIQANLAERNYDFSAARGKYLELIRLYPDDPTPYVSLAQVYEKQGQYKEAVANYEEALKRDSNYIRVYQYLGSIYAKTGDFFKALSNGERALDLYRALGNREAEARVLVALGEILREKKGNYHQAREYATSALNLFKDLQNESGVTEATLLLGNILYKEGELQEARRCYEKVLSTSGRIQNNRLVVQTLTNMGVTYIKEGDLTSASRYFEKSIAQERIYGEYRDVPTLEGRAKALTNLGSLLIEYGPDPERGLQYVQQALSIFQGMGYIEWEAKDRMLVGLYYMNVGTFEQALNQLQGSLSVFRRIENKPWMAQSTYNIGRCYFFQNHYEGALDSVQNALGLFQDAQDPFGVAMSQILLGWIYRRLGKGAEARALLVQGSQAAEKNGYGELLPDAYTALGELELDSSDSHRARQDFQRASDLWKGPNVSESSIEGRSNLCLVEAQKGDFERALSLCKASVVHARKLHHVHTLARALLNLASVRLLRKDYAQAIELVQEVSSVDEGRLGLELRAQAYTIQAKAFEGLERKETARASFRQARQAIGQLQQMLAVNHRSSFVERPDIKAMFP